jgi:D-alanine--D-alanine ligase
MRTPTEIETRFAPRESLAEAQAFFLVGIGGAGMSGIARLLLAAGHTVKGSDAVDSPLLAELTSLGAHVEVGHTGQGIEAGDAVILTDAIDLGLSPEVRAAEDVGARLYRRSQALGWLLKGRRVLAVTGTHGKTTTTGLAAAGMIAAGMDPLVVNGAETLDFGSSVVMGKGEWAVVEACEAYDALRDLDPEIAVVTNFEPDHLDFHGDWASLQARMLAFLQRSSAVAAGRQAMPVLESMGLAPVAPTPTLLPAEGLTLSGEHNRENAALALAACRLAGADEEAALRGIRGFRGAERRLQVLRDEGSPIAVVDDYAHHPTEISASIQALRERFPGRRLVVVYQPHLYSRTRDLLEGFAEALSHADECILTDIYPAREDPMPGMSSLRIAELMPRTPRYVPSRFELPHRVRQWVSEGDVVVGMGAGTIADFAPAFLAELDRPKGRIAVATGGFSAEREVSLHSGRAVLAALRRRGWDAFAIDPAAMLLTPQGLSRLQGAQRPDAAVMCVHGVLDEDGPVQGVFDLLGIPYSSSSVLASALAMDKAQAKQALSAHGLPTPKGRLAHSADDLMEDLTYPLVVKPNAQGSTVGLSFVFDPAQLRAALETALLFGPALVEEQVVGLEISVPVMGDRALLAVEIVPASGRYDFASKYTPGATEEICPPQTLTAEQHERARAQALAAHQALGCRGLTRTDMILRGDELVILEVNTIPGMTATSLAPRSAEAAGISFDDLAEWMVHEALR